MKGFSEYHPSFSFSSCALVFFFVAHLSLVTLQSELVLRPCPEATNRLLAMQDRRHKLVAKVCVGPHAGRVLAVRGLNSSGSLRCAFDSLLRTSCILDTEALQRTLFRQFAQNQVWIFTDICNFDLVWNIRFWGAEPAHRAWVPQRCGRRRTRPPLATKHQMNPPHVVRSSNAAHSWHYAAGSSSRKLLLCTVACTL